MPPRAGGGPGCYLGHGRGGRASSIAAWRTHRRGSCAAQLTRHRVAGKPLSCRYKNCTPHFYERMKHAFCTLSPPRSFIALYDYSAISAAGDAPPPLCRKSFYRVSGRCLCLAHFAPWLFHYVVKISPCSVATASTGWVGGWALRTDT